MKITQTIFIFLLVSLLGFAQRTQAQQPTITGSTCISPDPLAAVTVYNITVPAGVTVSGVGVLGDLLVTAVSTTFPTTANFTVSARSINRGRDTLNTCNNYLTVNGAKQWGFAKGRLIVSYNQGICGGYSVYLDINKLFSLHPPVVGPACLKVGDSVTYSVCPILSGNISAQIGQDRYYWSATSLGNYTNPAPPAGMSLLYYSGDSSSVTYLVISPLAVNTTLYCRFGQCNPTTVSSIALSQQPSRPTITANGPSYTSGTTICVPTSTSSITLTAAPTTAGTYTYQWSTNNTSWSFGTGTATATSGPSAGTVSVTLNLNQSQGQVYLRTIGGCDRVDTIRINRSLASPLIVTSSATNCIAAGSSPSFYINAAGANIGNLPITWTFAPTTGWSITGSQNGPTIVAAAAANAVSTTVTANVTGCPAPLSLAVYIKPGSPGTVTTTTTACLPQGVSNIARVYNATTVANAVNYTWTYPAGWTLPSAQPTATPTFTVTPNGTTIGSVCVTANSALAGCNTPGTCLPINFVPNVPDSIVAPVCIKGGNTEAVNLKAANSLVALNILTPVSGVTYTWNIPNGMRDLTAPAPTYGSSGGATNNIINFTCNGAAGTYTVTATASNVACGASGPKSRIITISLNNDSLWLSNLPGPKQELDMLTTVGAVDATISTYSWFKLIPARTPISNTPYFLVLPNSSTGGNFGVEVAYSTANTCNNVFVRATAYGQKIVPLKTTKQVDSDLKAITLQPNPASNSTTLILPAGKTNVGVSIVDSKGTLLWKRSTINSTQTTINTANWPAGEYTVLLHSTDGKTTSKKLVVNK